MPDSPSSVLSRAADLIRDTAAADLTPGRWEVRVTPSEDPIEDDTVWVACEHGSTVAVVGEAYTSAPRDARWIALMSPAVAPALEAVLRKAAYDVRRCQYAWRERIAGPARTEEEIAALVEEDFGAVLGLARAVLGVGEETPGDH